MANEENLQPQPPFKKGRKKTGGRKKGKLNKFTELKNTIDVLTEMKVDPTVFLVNLMNSTEDEDLAAKIAMELKRYHEAYKQKTEIDLNGEVEILVINKYREPDLEPPSEER